MIQNSLLFTTKFNVVPTVPKFVLTDTTNYASEGIALTDVVGVFKIEGPSGIIYNNTNFAAPDIYANVNLVFNTISLPLDTKGAILKGNYAITYTILVTGGVQAGTYIKTTVSYFCYEAPKGKIQVTNSVRLAKVTSKDLTPYNIGAIVPTITRSHKLYYPSALVLAPTTTSTDTITLSYPSVYTGTYTGEVVTTASYVFTDGLIVDYLVKAVDETIVDNSTLCDIYCGIKNLTNEMLAAKSTGDFGKAGQIEETLSLVSILYDLYDSAITCGKEDDATNWLNQIISLANITVGCGCTDDEPQLVIPEGGGGSGSGTSVVEGDSAFGTQVSSATVGSTTTYTVRLTQAYKDLILNALQSQDLSVAAFRAAGIPEEARGVNVVGMSAGGGSIALTPGTSKKVLVLTGAPNMSGSYTVSTSGPAIDGDSFVVDYRATARPNGNNVTIFGLSLSDAEISTGNCLVYTWYAASTSTWYSKLINNISGGASQEGLFFWKTGPDYAIYKPVLYGTNPSFIYTNIQSAGSGINPPTGTTASNTWWKFVGNKSALFDSSDNIVLDVTAGKPFIIPTLNSSSSVFEYLVLEGQEIKRRAVSSILLAGMALNNGRILVGNGSNVAIEKVLDTTYLRSLVIGGVSGNAFIKQTVPTSGTVSIDPNVSGVPYVLNGTVTLIGNVTISGLSGNPGDMLWIDYAANATLGGNSLTILGVSISATDALAGNFGIFGYFDSSSGVWVGKKVTYGITIPIGTANQTVRYNSSNVLVADPNVTQDASGNLVAALNVKAGTNHTGTGQKNLVGGSSNAVNGFNNVVVGSGNTVSSNNNQVSGSGNTVAGLGNMVAGSANNTSGSESLVIGSSNTVTDSDTIVVGLSNNVSGAAKVIGSNNAGSGLAGNQITGDNHSLGAFGAVYVFMSGIFGKAVNSYTKIFSNGTATQGKHQEEKGILFGSTSSATPVILALDSASTLFNTQQNAVYNFECKVVGIQSAGGAGTIGDSHAFVIKGAIKNISGVLSLVGSQVVDGDFSDAAASTWTAVFSAGATSLNLTVTGQASKTIQWTGSLTAVNAGY